MITCVQLITAILSKSNDYKKNVLWTKNKDRLKRIWVKVRNQDKVPTGKVLTAKDETPNCLNCDSLVCKLQFTTCSACGSKNNWQNYSRKEFVSIEE